MDQIFEYWLKAMDTLGAKAGIDGYGVPFLRSKNGMYAICGLIFVLFIVNWINNCQALGYDIRTSVLPELESYRSGSGGGLLWVLSAALRQINPSLQQYPQCDYGSGGTHPSNEG